MYITFMPAVNDIPVMWGLAFLPLSFAQDVHTVQMLHFAQLAAGRTSQLTLGMHILHSRTTTFQHLRAACWGGCCQYIKKSIL